MAKYNKWKMIDVNKRGLDMFIGPLEAAIMRAIWDSRRTTKKIWQHVRDHYETVNTDEISYSSVTSTITRLFDQGYLTRTGDRNMGFVYAPVETTETAFVTGHIRNAIAALIESYPREAGLLMVEQLRALRSPAEEGVIK